MRWNEALCEFVHQEGGVFLGSAGSWVPDGVGVLEHRGRQLVLCSYRAEDIREYGDRFYTRALITAELNAPYRKTAKRKNAVVKGLSRLLGGKRLNGDGEFDRLVDVDQENENFTRLVFQSTPLKEALLAQTDFSLAVGPTEEGSGLHLIEARTKLLPDEWFELRGGEPRDPYCTLDLNGVEVLRQLTDLARAAYDAVTEWRV